MHLLEKQDGFIFHCHFSFWRGRVHQPFIKPLILKPTQLMDLDWALHQPNFASCFHLEKKRPRLYVRTKDMRRFNQLFGQGVTHSPPRKKKKQPHLNQEHSFGNRLDLCFIIISPPPPPPSFSSSSTFCFFFLFAKKKTCFSQKKTGARVAHPGAPWRVPVSCVVGAAWGVRRCQNGRPNPGPWTNRRTKQVGEPAGR